MRYLFILAALLVPMTSTAEPTPDVIDALQAFYAKTTDLKASFSQEVEKAEVGLTLKKSGMAYFKKPGLMRWDYLQPEKVHYMSDGEHLYIYQVADNIIYKGAVKGSSFFLPFKFLLGEGNIKTDFVVDKIEPGKAEGTHRIFLLPKAGDTSFEKATIIAVEGEQGVTVGAITIVDPAGNSNAITFGKVDYDVGLPVEGFVTLPKGVPVQDLSKQAAPPKTPTKKKTTTP